ncbi:MAG: SLC13/DASS family transporter [Pirellulaceae bacterium]|nr:SLC13/DASS family transporter [Pirellulaceae bacterium]
MGRWNFSGFVRPGAGRRIGLWLGPLLFSWLAYAQPLPLAAGGNHVVAVAAWMLCWWISESVPLAVTALLPIVLFSLTGVMTLDEALQPYSSRIVYLFFGGFVLALGLEAHELHKRIALIIIGAVGLSPPRIVLGFLLATAALSMWISNTATAVMMLPMALSCLTLLSDQSVNSAVQTQGNERLHRNFSIALILAIAYGSSIGGMGTLIGTPPNLVMRGYFENSLNTEISFFSWMAWTIPIVLLILGAAYLLLTFVLFPSRGLSLSGAQAMFHNQRERLGPVTAAQWRMLSVFITTAGLWMFSGWIKPLLPTLPLTGQPIPLSDEIIAITAAIALFVVPGERSKGGALLDWEATRRLPWGILLLFGGGLSLASGMEKTGVILTLSEVIQSAASEQPVLLMVLLTGLSLLLTEMMSNVALVQVFVPIVCGLAISLGVDPLYFAMPATLASSCAFMLPMSTPPNAIVFATGQVTVRQMMWAGLWLNLTSLAIIVSICCLLFSAAGR